ncbi:MAG: hypothetical protein M3041_18285 [Acidobacteriota bacterium]|nr:hypothetical protein [Acidobacteriota bacterium]
MADEPSNSADFWRVLEEAKKAVAGWEQWQRQYRADIYYEGYPAEPVKAKTEDLSETSTPENAALKNT